MAAMFAGYARPLPARKRRLRQTDLSGPVYLRVRGRDAGYPIRNRRLSVLSGACAVRAGPVPLPGAELVVPDRVVIAAAVLEIFVYRYREKVPARFILLGLHIYALALSAAAGLQPAPALPGSRLPLRAGGVRRGAVRDIRYDAVLQHRSKEADPVALYQSWHLLYRAAAAGPERRKALLICSCIPRRDVLSSKNRVLICCRGKPC